MSFGSITEIYSVIAVCGSKKYYVSSLDVNMDLGGSMRTMFTILGAVSDNDVLEDLSEIKKDDEYITNGSWVSIEIEYAVGKGKPQSNTVIDGRIQAINDAISTSGASISIYKGYVLVSDLEFIDKLPIGSLLVIGHGAATTPAGALIKNFWESEYRAACKGTKLNIAKLAATLIDGKTYNNQGNSSGNKRSGYIPTPNAKISDRVLMTTAPCLNTSGIVAVAKSIKDEIQAKYASETPLGLFTNILSRFFLICVPRTLGVTEVIENNGWSSHDSLIAKHLDPSLITGLQAVDATGEYPGFDAVAVRLTPENAKTAGDVTDASQFVLRAEVVDGSTGLPKLVHGTLKCFSKDGTGMTVSIPGGGTFDVGKAKQVFLRDWMVYAMTSDTRGTSKSNATLSRDTQITWAKFLTYNTYAAINRITNRVSIELRLLGYFDLADNIGSIMSFNIPGHSKKYYGRLHSVGLRLSLDQSTFSAKATATFDCVRDEEDNKNLCIDFSIYE